MRRFQGESINFVIRTYMLGVTLHAASSLPSGWLFTGLLCFKIKAVFAAKNPFSNWWLWAAWFQVRSSNKGQDVMWQGSSDHESDHGNQTLTMYMYHAVFSPPKLLLNLRDFSEHAIRSDLVVGGA